MKIERLLLGLFASFLMVGCSQNDDLPNGGEEQEKENQSYIAINVNAVKDAFSRADESFDFGNADEQKVSNALFFFFNATGQPFSVGNGKNYVNVTTGLDDTQQTETGSGSVESILKPVLVIEHHKGDIPSSIVAVLNWSYSGESLSLDNLLGESTLVADANKSSDAGFIMSNSVYLDAQNKKVVAVPLKAENLQSTEAGAKEKPVTIFVERLAAKVIVNGKKSDNGTDNITFDTSETVEQTEGVTTKVYAKIENWELNTTNTHSYMLKNINDTWTATGLGFDWNSVANHRSYWAEAYVPKAFDASFDYDDLKGDFGTPKYCLENTITPISTDDFSKLTKIIVKATLQDEKGKPLTIARWYGNDDYTIDGLKDKVAETLKDDLLLKTTDTGNDVYTPIDGDQLDFDYIKNEEGVLVSKDSYRVKFVLKEGVSTSNWYKKTAGEYVQVDNPNAVLETIQPAEIWSEGRTYYFANIKHLNPTEKSGEAYNEGYYGIVRNHQYIIEITGVTGLGTPVYVPIPDPDDPDEPDPDIPEIPDPIDPSETQSYIAAQINVLSWKLVNNSVVLGQ